MLFVRNHWGLKLIGLSCYAMLYTRDYHAMSWFYLITMLYPVMFCCVMLCCVCWYVTLTCVMLYHVRVCGAILCRIMLRWVLLCRCTMLRYFMLCCAIMLRYVMLCHKTILVRAFSELQIIINILPWHACEWHYRAITVNYTPNYGLACLFQITSNVFEEYLCRRKLSGMTDHLLGHQRSRQTTIQFPVYVWLGSSENRWFPSGRKQKRITHNYIRKVLGPVGPAGLISHSHIDYLMACLFVPGIHALSSYSNTSVALDIFIYI